MFGPITGDPIEGIGDVNWEGVIISVTTNYFGQEFVMIQWTHGSAGHHHPLTPMTYPIELLGWSNSKGVWTISLIVEELPVGSDAIREKIDQAKERIKKEKEDTDYALSCFRRARVIEFLGSWTVWFDWKDREDGESN